MSDFFANAYWSGDYFGAAYWGGGGPGSLTGSATGSGTVSGTLTTGGSSGKSSDPSRYIIGRPVQKRRKPNIGLFTLAFVAQKPEEVREVEAVPVEVKVQVADDPLTPGGWVRRRKKIRVEVDDEAEDLVVDRYVYKPDTLLGDLAEMLGVPIPCPFTTGAISVGTKSGRVQIDADDMDEEDIVAIVMALMA
jgi:hypothetical protein